MGAHSQSGSAVQLAFPIGKQLAQRIFLETLAAIEVRRAMLAKLQWQGQVLQAGDIRFPLPRPPRVIAFGKAACRMAAVLVEILGGYVESGLAVGPAEPATRLPRFRYFVGGHPDPNADSFAAGAAALELVSGLGPDETVIFLVSGGGSALFEKPVDPAITLGEFLEFNRVLVRCGLPIEQINILRKHVSAVKGGRLAVRAYPARQLTIYISDVPDHLPSMIASGPTLPDESTVEQACAIAAQHQLTAKFPPRIRERFELGALAETPKPGDARFAHSSYFCLLSNRDAVEAARAAAERLGFVSEIDRNVWDVDYQQLVRANLASLDVLAQAHPGQPVCLVVGGEVTCPVTGPGLGGRNQAFALFAARLIAGRKRVVLSAGTDGRDGNSPTSGAVADGQTIARAEVLGLDPEQYLAESDAYSFFRSLGDTVDIGFSDNNVRDVRLWLDFGP
jgi:hydroxypyruvate reductase